MEAILGLAMLYAIIHGMVIVGKKISGLTSYEKVVLIVGAVSIGLLLIGIMFE